MSSNSNNRNNTLSFVGSFLVFAATLSISPLAQSQVGELRDNNAAIIPLCNCVSSPEMAETPNCRQLLSSNSPERQPQGTNPSNAAHVMMQQAGGTPN